MQYLANGNVSSEQIVRPGFTAYQGFAYDGANRLCSANESASPGNGPANCTATPPGGLNWAQQYVYDPVGNQAVVGTVMPGLTATPMATSVTSTVPFNSQNQYTGASYDNAGNMKSVSAATMQLTYDAEGRMITETDNGASPPVTATFTYDGQGRRVRKATGSGTTYYTYGPMGELISETGGTALPKTTYLTADHLGSTRLVTNSAAYLGCHDYLPFGQEILASYGTRANSLCYDLPDTDIQFTGQVRDTDTTFSLDYFGARYLSGTMGRWSTPDLINVTEDRLIIPHMLNKYVYAGDNPLRQKDLDGRDVVALLEPPHGFSAGHFVLFANNPDNGQSAMMSFGPSDRSAANESIVVLGGPVGSTTTFGWPNNAEDLRQNYAALSIQTTPEQVQDVINFIHRLSASADPYALYSTNCTTVCRDALKVIGILPKNFGVIAPFSLWSNLFGRFGNPAKQRYRTTSRYGELLPSLIIDDRRGTDYGNPRFGMDTFDFIMLMLHPPVGCVTVSDSATGTKSTDCQ